MALRHDFERFPLNGVEGVRVGFSSMAYVGGFSGRFSWGEFLTRARARLTPCSLILVNSLGGLKGIGGEG